jgi:hypothetical protein
MKNKTLLLSLLTTCSFRLMCAQSTNPAPYCVADFDDGFSYVGDAINSVSIGSLTNTSNAHYAFPHYVYYNNLSAPALIKGNTYTLNLAFNVHGGCGYGVWIDYNKNNVFEVGEKIAGSTSGASTLNISSNTPISANVVIPGNASEGITRMRVRIVEDDMYNGMNDFVTLPCNASTSSQDVMDWGETEDYNLNLMGATGVENNGEVRFQIYPNPFNNIVALKGNAFTQLMIYNMLDEKVFEEMGSFTQKDIDLSHLKNGMYVMKVLNGEGEIESTIIIKQ